MSVVIGAVIHAPDKTTLTVTVRGLRGGISWSFAHPIAVPRDLDIQQIDVWHNELNRCLARVDLRPPSAPLDYDNRDYLEEDAE